MLLESTGVNVDKRFGCGRSSGAHNPLVGTRLFSEPGTPPCSPFKGFGGALALGVGLCLGLCLGFGSVFQRIFLSLKGLTWYSYTALL